MQEAMRPGFTLDAWYGLLAPAGTPAAVIERLLASPHYGERWGRHWLDLARYAESDGYENDKIRKGAWIWRDWVIDAYNAAVMRRRRLDRNFAGGIETNAEQRGHRANTDGDGRLHRLPAQP